MFFISIILHLYSIFHSSNNLSPLTHSCTSYPSMLEDNITLLCFVYVLLCMSNKFDCTTSFSRISMCLKKHFYLSLLSIFCFSECFVIQIIALTAAIITMPWMVIIAINPGKLPLNRAHADDLYPTAPIHLVTAQMMTHTNASNGNTQLAATYCRARVGNTS